MARMNPNITVAADLAALDKNVTESLEDGEAAVQKTVVDDASEMWLGSKEDLDAVADVGDFPEIEQAMPEEVISPAQQVPLPHSTRTRPNGTPHTPHPTHHTPQSTHHTTHHTPHPTPYGSTMPPQSGRPVPTRHPTTTTNTHNPQLNPAAPICLLGLVGQVALPSTPSVPSIKPLWPSGVGISPCLAHGVVGYRGFGCGISRSRVWGLGYWVHEDAGVACSCLGFWVPGALGLGS